VARQPAQAVGREELGNKDAGVIRNIYIYIYMRDSVTKLKQSENLRGDPFLYPESAGVGCSPYTTRTFI